jgi:nitrite reductase (NADH) small subunit
MADWHRLISLAELPAGSGREFTVKDSIIALFRVDDDLFAIDGICAHAAGPLAKGKLQGTIVTCPWHGWQYDVSSGQHCLTPSICQRTFPVKVEAGEVFIELP